MSARRRLFSAAAAFLLLSGAAGAARAQDVGVFQFFVNLQPKGEIFVRQERDGLWIKMADLQAGGLTGVKGETRLFSGEAYNLETGITNASSRPSARRSRRGRSRCS